MKCIIVDDEPIARKGIQKLVEQIPDLVLLNTFENAEAAGSFLKNNEADLIFLDIQMPGISGIEFASMVSETTLIIFTTAYAEFALDSYEVDAVDYLVKPIHPERFNKAVEKALAYHQMLIAEEANSSLEKVEADFIFVKSDRRYFKVNLKDILFIEGLKDYVIIQLEDKRLITHTTLKAMHDSLPQNTFLRVNRSYIINRERIDSFSNNDVFIDKFEIAIGNTYRDSFFAQIMN